MIINDFESASNDIKGGFNFSSVARALDDTGFVVKGYHPLSYLLPMENHLYIYKMGSLRKKHYDPHTLKEDDAHAALWFNINRSPNEKTKNWLFDSYKMKEHDISKIVDKLTKEFNVNIAVDTTVYDREATFRAAVMQDALLKSYIYL